MGIIQAPAVNPGQVGVIGAIKFMTTTVNLATLTAAGYLNAIDLAVNPVAANDVLGITYGYNLQTRSGTFGLFSVAIANGVITLAQIVDAGNVLLPVVAGDVPVFNGTTGQISDSGILATNLVVLNAVNTMAAGSSIVLAKVNGTEAGNAVTASGVAGLLTTSSLTTAGAGSYVITWTNTFITATSSVLLTLAGGTNTTENITLKAIPGAGSATLTIYNNTAATALNGTITISYLVV